MGKDYDLLFLYNLLDPNKRRILGLLTRVGKPLDSKAIAKELKMSERSVSFNLSTLDYLGFTRGKLIEVRKPTTKRMGLATRAFIPTKQIDLRFNRIMKKVREQDHAFAKQLALKSPKFNPKSKEGKVLNELVNQIREQTKKE